jgi:hypothetical protein
MKNYLSLPTTTNYYWSFSIDRWDGTKWITTGISGSSTLLSYVLPALTTVELPYYIYLLPKSGPNNVTWCNWLRINFTFHLIYGGVRLSVDQTAKLHVHPGDIAGGVVALPYFGSDTRVGIEDVNPVAWYWGAPVSWTGAFDPTDPLHIASVTMGSRIGIDDLNPIAWYWGKAWTNTPPPG